MTKPIRKRRQVKGTPPGPTPPVPDVAAGYVRWSTAHLVLASTTLAALLLVLHGQVLRWPFLSDDFIFLDASREVGRLFTSFDDHSNYFRPIGRELYFLLGHRLAGNDPLPWHLFNFAVLSAIVGLVVALGRRLAGPRVGLLAGVAYALLYSHHLTLAWISCAQDLLAACLGLLAAHALCSGRRGRAGLWHLAAMLAKESVAAFPLVVTVWRALDPTAGRSWPERLATGVRASAPLWAATAAWAAIVLGARVLRQAWARGEATPLADVTLSAGSLWGGLRSALLSYFALEQPWSAVAQALTTPEQPWLPLTVALAIVSGIVWAGRRVTPPPAAPARGRDRTLLLGALWAVIGALPIALAGHHFSAYYITFSGIGFALCLGSLLGAAHPALILAVFAVQLVVGNAADRVDVFNFAKMAPTMGVSYVTTTRLEIERRFLDSLHVALDRVRPARGSVVYLSHAPRYTTFVTMGGRAASIWYEDPALELRMIGEFRGETMRPHAFLRFVDATRGFVQVPNDLMSANLAAEDAMIGRRASEAIAHLDHALSLLPPSGLKFLHLEMLDNRGIAAMALDDTAAARESWRHAVALDPGFKSAALNLAAVDARGGRWAAARATLERFLLHTAEDVDALDLLVRVQQAQGDPVAAEATLTRLSERGPSRARVLAPPAVSAP